MKINRVRGAECEAQNAGRRMRCAGCRALKQRERTLNFSLKSSSWTGLCFILFAISPSHGSRLDGSGGNVILDPQHYKRRIRETAKRIEDLNKDITKLKGSLAALRSCVEPSGESSDPSCAARRRAVANQITQTEEARSRQQRENTRAKNNLQKIQQNTSARSAVEEALANAGLSAKAKAEKTGEFLSTTTAINAAAGGYFASKCSSTNKYACVLSGLAFKQAGETDGKAKDIGNVAVKLGDGTGGKYQGGLPEEFCNANPRLCGPSSNPPSPPGSPPSPEPPVNIPCPQLAKSPGGLCQVSGPSTAGLTGGVTNGPITVTTPEGDKITVPPLPKSMLDGSHPDIKQAMKKIRSDNKALFAKADRLAEELGYGGGGALTAESSGDASPSGSPANASSSASSNPLSTALSPSAVLLELEDAPPGEKGDRTFGKGLYGQFNKKKSLTRDLAKDKAVTFGEDQIGVREDNIFLMMSRSYKAHRKDGQFIQKIEKI